MNKITNEQKLQACEQYESYLKIIHTFGNNVMLLKQLKEIGKELGLFNYDAMFQRQMERLVEYDIIKHKTFEVGGQKTQHKIVILKKFALRYLKGFTDSGGSQKVAPVPPLNTNDRILLSTFKTSFILEKVIPTIQKSNKTVTLDEILSYIKKKHMSLLVEKNKGIEYARYFFETFKVHLQEEPVLAQIERMQASLDKRKAGLDAGSKAIEGKGKASNTESGIEKGKKATKATGQLKAKDELFSNKDKKLKNYSFENMVRSNIQIIQVVRKGEFNLHVHALIFDYLNKRDLYSLSKQIACFFKMLNDSMNHLKGYRVHLSVGIVAHDQVAMEVMEREANEVIYSVFTGSQDKRMKLSLKNWQVDEEQQTNNLSIHFTHYDITNKYLEGRKIANLQQVKASQTNVEKTSETSD